MKILLDIEDHKAINLLKALERLAYVKTKVLSETQDISELGEAVEEMNLVNSGKTIARDAEEFLQELFLREDVDWGLNGED